LPFEAEIEETIEFSYLDFIGRPVRIIKKQNVLDDYHDLDFQITYRFQQHKMLMEPFYVFCFCFTLMLTAIFFTRFDLGLQDEEKKKTD